MIKPKIKVNFLYYENPFSLEKNFIYKMLIRHFDVVISKNPDYVFFSVYKENNKFLNEDGTIAASLATHSDGLLKRIYKRILAINFVKNVMWHLRDTGIIKPYAKIIDIKGKFVRIFYSCESIKTDMRKCDWAFAFDNEDDINNPRYMRVPPYVFFGYNFDLHKRTVVDKTKFCNFVYNNYVPFRNKLFRKLGTYKYITSPGKCMQNALPINCGDTDRSRSSNDWEVEKIKYQRQFKFSIACENKIKRGYNTDRIIHAYLAGSIPIYYGDPEIEKDFNHKCFINLNDCKNYKEAIDKIKRVDTDYKIYEDMIKQPLFDKNVILDYDRIEKRLKDIIK
jgi:hypothetical protein